MRRDLAWVPQEPSKSERPSHFRSGWSASCALALTQLFLPRLLLFRWNLHFRTLAPKLDRSRLVLLLSSCFFYVFFPKKVPWKKSEAWKIFQDFYELGWHQLNSANDWFSSLTHQTLLMTSNYRDPLSSLLARFFKRHSLKYCQLWISGSSSEYRDPSVSLSFDVFDLICGLCSETASTCPQSLKMNWSFHRIHLRFRSN